MYLYYLYAYNKAILLVNILLLYYYLGVDFSQFFNLALGNISLSSFYLMNIERARPWLWINLTFFTVVVKITRTTVSKLQVLQILVINCRGNNFSGDVEVVFLRRSKCPIYI